MSRARRTDHTATLATNEARADLYLKLTMVQATISTDFTFVWSNLEQFQNLDKKLKKKVDDGSIFTYKNCKLFIDEFGFKAMLTPKEFKKIKDTTIAGLRSAVKSLSIDQKAKTEVINGVKSVILKRVQEDMMARGMFYAVINKYNSEVFPPLHPEFFVAKGAAEMHKIFFSGDKVAKLAVKNDYKQEKEIDRETGKWAKPVDDNSDTLPNERSYRSTRDFINYYIKSPAIYAVIFDYIAPSQTPKGDLNDLLETAGGIIQNIRVYNLIVEALNQKDELAFQSQFMHLYYQEMYYTGINPPKGLGADVALPKRYKKYREGGAGPLQKMPSLVPYAPPKAFSAKRKTYRDLILTVAMEVKKNVDSNKINKVSTLQQLREGVTIIVTEESSSTKKKKSAPSTVDKKKSALKQKKKDQLAVPSK